MHSIGNLFLFKVAHSKDILMDRLRFIVDVVKLGLSYHAIGLTGLQPF